MKKDQTIFCRDGENKPKSILLAMKNAGKADQWLGTLDNLTHLSYSSFSQDRTLLTRGVLEAKELQSQMVARRT
jgi:hypothetical protein